MNVKEITPTNNGMPVPYKLVHYAAIAVALTLASIWIIIAFQSKNILGENTNFWKRLGWPYVLLHTGRTRRKRPLLSAVIINFIRDPLK